MTDREQQIMELLRQDPMLPQGEIAKRLGITWQTCPKRGISWARAMCWPNRQSGMWWASARPMWT